MFGTKRKARGRPPLLVDEVTLARQLIEATQRNEPVATLLDLAGHLDGLRVNAAALLSQVCEVVDLIDRAGRPAYRKLSHEYVLGQRRLTKFQEEQVWNTVWAYLGELAQAYRYVLAKYEVGADGARALTPQLPVLTARALRLYAARLKWCYLRYRPIAPAHWAELNALYSLAERSGYVDGMVSLYRGAGTESSVRREFVKALMLASASPEALLPEQVEVAERLIARCEPDLVLGTGPNPACYHYVDLGSDSGPHRLPTAKRLPDSARTFGAADGIARLRTLEQALDEDRITPGELSLTQEFDVEVVQATLRHLLKHWGPPLAMRRHERRRQVARMQVVHDFGEVSANVGGLTVEYPFVSEQEEWLIENESESGLRAVVPSPNGRWIQVGRLIAFRKGDDIAWRTGIVRRVVREDDDTRYVAIETIATGGAGVTVLPLPGANRKEAGDGVLCTLLSVSDAPRDEVTLLLPDRMYSASAAREMRAYDRRYRLVPLRLLESGETFQVARYKVLRIAE